MCLLSLSLSLSRISLAARTVAQIGKSKRWQPYAHCSAAVIYPVLYFANVPNCSCIKEISPLFSSSDICNALWKCILKGTGLQVCLRATKSFTKLVRSHIRKAPVKYHKRRGSQTNKSDFNSFANVENDRDESRMASGSLFRARGPAMANDLSLNEVRMWWETSLLFCCQLIRRRWQCTWTVVAWLTITQWCGTTIRQVSTSLAWRLTVTRSQTSAVKHRPSATTYRQSDRFDGLHSTSLGQERSVLSVFNRSWWIASALSQLRLLSFTDYRPFIPVKPLPFLANASRFSAKPSPAERPVSHWHSAKFEV